MRFKLPDTIGMLGKGVRKLLLTLNTKQAKSSFINTNTFCIRASHEEILLIARVKEFTRYVGHISNTLMIVSAVTPWLMKGHL